MADDLDKMLDGNDNPSVSSAQDGSQQVDSIQGNPIEQQPEEVEFNKLSGSARDRIKAIWARAREAEEALEAERSTRQTYVPPAPASNLAPDQETAIKTLEKFGISTDSKVDQKLAQVQNQILWNFEQQRLEEKYTGENDEPQYVREEVEDYIRKHPQYAGYAAEDVFKYKMFPDEFENLKTPGTPKRTSTLKPTKAQVMDETLTPEYIEERLKQPDGQQWYTDHLDEINNVVKNHTLQFKGKI